jgi:Domain of unknown function (DUF4838)/Carbohydrate family 9 binding domain-like
MKTLFILNLLVFNIFYTSIFGAETKTLNPVRFFTPLTTQKNQLVNNGLSKATIVKCDNSNDSANINLAAKELQLFIYKSTGAKLSIINEKSYKKGTAIFLGNCRILKKYNLQLNKLKKEGFYIASIDNGIVIAGRDSKQISPKGYSYSNCGERGTLWGVYEFLERFVGVRWYFPGKYGTSIVKKKDLIITPVFLEDAPVFLKREFQHRSQTSRRLRAGRSTPIKTICHTPKYMHKVYGKNHPEYFALKKNKTRSNALNYSSEKLIKQMFHDLKIFYTQGSHLAWGMWHLPTKKMIPISPLDQPIACQCEKCKKLYRKKDGMLGEASNIMGTFLAKFANKAKIQFPDKKVVFVPYQNYTMPPVGISLPDNVVIQLCGMRGIANYKEPQIAKDEQKILDGWKKLTKNKIHTWHYGCWPANNTSAVFFYPHILQKYYKNNRNYIAGTFINTFNDWDRQHLNYYIWLKLLWNPNFDVDAAINEYSFRMYGKAAKPIRRIITILTDRWEKIRWKTVPAYHNISPSNIHVETFTQTVVNRIKKLLKHAKTLAANDKIVQERIRYIEKPLNTFFQESELFWGDDNEIKSINAQLVADNIAIDGKLNEPYWENAPKEFLSNSVKDDNTANNETYVQVLWTKNAVIFGVKMEEPTMNKIKATCSARDEAVYSDDCIEFFIDPDGKREKYYQIAINSLGTVFDGYSLNRDFKEWNAKGLKVATFSGKKYWNVEVYIPFSAFKVSPPKINSSWLVNFCRSKMTSPKALLRLNNIENQKSNHDTLAFSKLNFIE